MAVEVNMPVITAEGEEAVVTAWFVDEGGACTEGQLIAEVQAEKIAAEVEAPAPGLVVDLVGIHDPVAQGSPICRITDTLEAPAPAEVSPAPAQAPDTTGTRVVASPAAKRVAGELGVDLAIIQGTGPGGRVTEADVRAASQGEALPSPLRVVIARNMRRSHAETAPVTLLMTVDLGVERPTQITATVVRTVAEVLSRHPDLNGVREGDSFVPAETTHVAVAIQTDEGLVAPVVRDPAGMSLDEVEASIRRLADAAKAKTLTAEDYADATFTVTNLGSYGIEGFTPIINLPQVAILGVGAARQMPAVDEAGAVVARYLMVLSLTFDHAFVDGAPAAAFLQEVGQVLGGW
jgi:pyruvate dehydrogenase E2 component (dihydrolipoamide acetyltransferase)